MHPGPIVHVCLPFPPTDTCGSEKDDRAGGNSEDKRGGEERILEKEKKDKRRSAV